MKRRETLKLFAAAAVLPPRAVAKQAQVAEFLSDWHEWPDMSWAGPRHWGNRLQDWKVEGGVLVCRVRDRNRSLHCLTHRATGADYRMEVAVDPGEATIPEARFGFRLGAKGPFPDYRSAAVRGTGIDAGITGDGRLFIGEEVARQSIRQLGPLRLSVIVSGSTVEVVASDSTGGAIGRLGRSDIARADLEGNLALVSHVDDPREGGGASFSHWHITGRGITADESAAYGPIMFTQFTRHRGTLKLTAQLAPVDEIEGAHVALETRTDDAWVDRGRVDIDALSRTARFRAEEFRATIDVPFRVRTTIPRTTGDTSYVFEGVIPAEPDPSRPLKIAAFSCNADHGFPDNEVVRHVSVHAPDVAVFLGDQFYEGSGGFGIQRDSVRYASLDMLHKWYMFGWSYREIFRNIPSACIPDDHDVYHGNIWGEGGALAPTNEGWGAVAQDQGGFKMPAEWVNAVQRCQTSHLPDPHDPTPVKQDIGVYYCRWDYGAASFAIIEDRKFKSAPGNVLPDDAQVLNGWIHNPDFDVRQHRDVDAVLLGARQEHFLTDWASDAETASGRMKVLLSQTNFAAVHTIPESASSGAVLPGLPMPEPGQYVPGDKLAVDMDSNGWPQNRRDETLRVLRRARAFHIAGDQHLATVVRHGVEGFDDAIYTFTGPALNNIWPRRWWPPASLKVAPLDGGPDYAGRFFDGFGNRVTVHAAANPRATGLTPTIIRDRVTGYGMVTLNPQRGTVTIECWPRQSDPRRGADGQYEGWPITVTP